MTAPERDRQGSAAGARRLTEKGRSRLGARELGTFELDRADENASFSWAQVCSAQGLLECLHATRQQMPSLRAETSLVEPVDGQGRVYEADETS